AGMPHEVKGLVAIGETAHMVLPIAATEVTALELIDVTATSDARGNRRVLLECHCCYLAMSLRISLESTRRGDISVSKEAGIGTRM
ncbi:MAG: hypothetical protein ACXVCX_15850, partial [Ktedonobacterales bacterium]